MTQLEKNQNKLKQAPSNNQTNQEFHGGWEEGVGEEICTWTQNFATVWNLLLNWDLPLISKSKNEYLFGQLK